MILRQPAWRRLMGTELPILLVLTFALAPYAWMVVSSIKPTAELTRVPLVYWPDAATLGHYADLLKRTSFAVNLTNSLVVALGAVVLGLGVSIPAAYAFSRFRFPGRRVLLVTFLVVNMFPIVLLIIPLFILMRSLGLLDSYGALVLGHGTFAIPFAVWMLTSYMNGIPVELDEAAMIDGCSRLATIRRIVLPLAAPGIATTGIYIFITSWNEYLYAMMLSGHDVRTVTVALQLFIGEFQIQWGMLTAGGTLVALPVTILFLFVQRRLVGGLTAGAVKS